MRSIAVVAVLLIGMTSASPVLPPVQTMEPAAVTATPSPSPAAQAGPAPGLAPVVSMPSPSLDNVCNTLFNTAQANDLPVAFFANLIWQESRLRHDAVSPKGAVGIAQFMPQVAATFGVDDPFDPAQELPAAAKLLRTLFDRFGNLGYVAAAYNAGTRRVLDWLEHGRSLPRETRNYVKNITGRSIEAWRKTDSAELRFACGLPCNGFAAFAELVQAQEQQAGLEQAGQASAGSVSSQSRDGVATAVAPSGPVATKAGRAAAGGREYESGRGSCATNDRSHEPAKTAGVARRQP